MSSRTVRLSAAVLALLVLPVASASAREPDTGLRLGFGLAAGLPLNASPGGARGTFNPEQVGFYASFGLTVPHGLYLGVAVMPFLGQKSGGNQYMTQMFTFDLGWAIQTAPKLSVRPMLTFGANRYGIRHSVPPSSADRGFLLAPGFDVIVDLLPRFSDRRGHPHRVRLHGDASPAISSFSAGGNDISLRVSSHDRWREDV